MAPKLSCILVVFYFLRGFQLSHSSNIQKDLRDFLFNNKTHTILPIEKHNDIVTVEFGITLIKIKDVNAKEQTIQVHVWITQKWTNPFLKWNDNVSFSNISSINVKAGDIWVPDIILYNNVDEQDRIGGGPETYKTMVILLPNGTNIWSSPALFKTICRVEVDYFPLDKQLCQLKFGSWTYDTTQLQIKNVNISFPSCHYMKNGEWIIYEVNTSTSQMKRQGKGSDNMYMDVTMKIDMTRECFDYLINLVIPCLMISSMIFLGFILPPESGERIGLGITVLLAMTVFQQLTAEIMPSYDFPLLGQYYFATLLELAFALVITTIILNIYHRTNRHMPGWLNVVLLHWLARVVFLYESAEKCRRPRKKTIQRGMKDNVDAVINNGYVIGERSMGSHYTAGERSSCENGNGCGESEDTLRPRSNTTNTSRFTGDHNVLKLTLGSIGSELNPNSQNEQGLFTDETGATVSEAEMRLRHQQWTLAAKILDRFFLWVAIIIGIVTVLAMFLRAPRVWEHRIAQPVPACS